MNGFDLILKRIAIVLMSELVVITTSMEHIDRPVFNASVEITDDSSKNIRQDTIGEISVKPIKVNIDGIEITENIIVHDINLNLPNAQGGFIWASDLHINMDEVWNRQDRKKAMGGQGINGEDLELNYERLLKAICSFAYEENKSLVLGGDILDYVSQSNVNVYQRATTEFMINDKGLKLYYIQSDHDTEYGPNESSPGSGCPESSPGTSPKITELNGVIGRSSASFNIGDSKIAMAYNRYSYGASYNEGYLDENDVILYHVPMDYGSGSAYNYINEKKKKDGYVHETKYGYFKELADKTRGAGALIAGHTHLETVEITHVTRNDKSADGNEIIGESIYKLGSLILSEPAFNRHVYRINLGNGNNTGIPLN